MLSGASITKLTERLSDIGLVRRRRSDRDGRVVLLELTEAGRELVDTQFPRRLARDTKILESLSPQERAQLITLLRKVSAALPQ
jgi:DNA-binding MarR family transcriptional regulator